MAGALVGGAFLSGFINVVFDRLFSPEAANLIQGKKLDQYLVQRLQTALSAAEALVIDAEMKQFHDSSVKTWLDSLKDALYVADDLLDLIFTKAATHKKNEVSNYLPTFLNFKDRKMVTDLEDIVRRIEDIEKRKYILGLKQIPKDNLSWRTATTSLIKMEMKIRGRENDKEALIKLLKAETTEAKINVIPIVGMGGVGKTTLAQWLYNDDELMKEFDLKVWICVSEEFDIVKITQTIVEAITHRPCNMKDFNLLQHDLKDKLKGKKFFIVLDDLWSDDCHRWNNFLTPFQYGVKGSKILVTTRNMDVASVVQSCPPYLLNKLSDEHCWSVFKDNACYHESSGNSTLEEIGRKIVKKCEGLPLAAETLGGLLRTKHDTKNWNAILKTNLWEFSLKDSKIIPALLISYYHLPPHLKRCFVYCSLFPKDYRFDKDELILLWMAEDLLDQPEGGKTFEEVGSECFDDLASRLFFKQGITKSNCVSLAELLYVKLSKKEYFFMHDLMHDLATSLGGGFYFQLEELGNADKMSMMTRHLSYKRLSHPISKNFDAISRIKSLRTLLQIGFSTTPFSIENTILTILSKFKCLRVLSFVSFKELDVLPDSICELIHLRYLNLSETNLKTLPESLGDLYNLQTLNLLNCNALTMLPNGMQNLVNLRHLDIRGTYLKEMPRGMSKLKNLQILSYFVVGKHEENGIMELGDLSNLHGSLHISKLENVANSSDALKARIMDKTHIDELYLEWSIGGDMVPSSEHERDIFDKLKPHKGLQELTIKCYKGTRFPNWVGHSSYHNMTRVSLSSCSNCCRLPSLGQLPSLKSLHIADFDGLFIIGDEFYKNDHDYSSSATPFPSLEDLDFYGMSCWEVWHSSESNAFPKLKTLNICHCPRLTGNLPDHLPALEDLTFNKLSCWQVWHSSQPNAFPQLKKLTIYDCPTLMGNLPSHLPALETLSIDNCDQLVYSLPKALAIQELHISKSDKILLQEIPLSLKSITIAGCEVVKSMFQAMSINHLTCLQILRIEDCSCAISFMIPMSLISLQIHNCRKMELPKQEQLELLHYLSIKNSCNSLTSFPLESFPNINNLELDGCENLESLSVSQSQVYVLHTLVINNCPNLVCFPTEGLAAPNMTKFYVTNCDKLNLLPSRMNTLLPKLEFLWITDCPEIELFPYGGLPPNLKKLLIYRSDKLLRNISSMGVHEGLTYLWIEGPCESVKSFPKELLLPQLPNLTTLTLGGFPNIETLDCKELLHLTSLQVLAFYKCPKLKNVIGERLPVSLIKLEINHCPLLEELCKMKHPQIWPKISHIRGIRIGERWLT